jgi:hypothetical protein
MKWGNFQIDVDVIIYILMAAVAITAIVAESC